MYYKAFRASPFSQESFIYLYVWLSYLFIPHKNRTVKGKTPRKAEKEWLDKICQVGCIVCWKEMDVYSPAEPHHIVSGPLNPKGRKDHMLTIPLCPAHHRFNLNNDQCVSRHYYKAEFEKRYGTEAELLKKTKELVENLH